MHTRKVGSLQLSEIGLGCMNLNHAYGGGLDRAAAEQLLRAAVELGVTHFDTAALYGFGTNEEWVGAALRPFRGKVHIASKCGMTGINGRRTIDGRPETLRATCLESLRRLQVDVIDLYYLHRWDRAVPLEDSIGALADLVREGLIREIGVSEVSAPMLRKAHAIHPVAAVQMEYSLWTRNPEIALLRTSAELGIALVAFSPLGRGFLAGSLSDPTTLQASDIRRRMPRFGEPHFARNLKLLAAFEKLATEAGCTKSQLALAWLLDKAPHVLPIVGTRSRDHLADNVGASKIKLSPDIVRRLECLINTSTVSGARYPPETLAEIETEEFSIARGRAERLAQGTAS